jgi:hypothetical protein
MIKVAGHKYIRSDLGYRFADENDSYVDGRLMNPKNIYNTLIIPVRRKFNRPKEDWDIIGDLPIESHTHLNVAVMKKGKKKIRYALIKGCVFMSRKST